MVVAAVTLLALSTVVGSLLMVILPAYGNPAITRSERWGMLSVGIAMIVYVLAANGRRFRTALLATVYVVGIWIASNGVRWQIIPVALILAILTAILCKMGPDRHPVQ